MYATYHSLVSTWRRRGVAATRALVETLSVFRRQRLLGEMAAHDHPVLVSILLEYADPTADYPNAIELAARYGHVRVIQVLMTDRRVPLYLADPDCMALARAIGSHQEDMVRYLLAHAAIPVDMLARGLWNACDANNVVILRMIVEALPPERVLAQWSESLWWITKKQGLQLMKPMQSMEINSTKTLYLDGGIASVLFLLDWMRRNHLSVLSNLGTVISKAAVYAAVCDQFHLLSLFLLEPALDPWFDNGQLMYLLFDTLKKPLVQQPYESVGHFERRREEVGYAWMCYVHWRTHARNKDGATCGANNRLMYTWKRIWEGAEAYLARKLCADTLGHVMSFVGKTIL